MAIEICTAEDIFYLNEKKEYTLTASCLLEHLLTNKSLTSQAVKLWQILYNESKFNKHLEVTIRYNHLAEKLGVSIRSINRYIRNLKENGYLLIKHNFGINGQLENTIIIRVPKELISDLHHTKDREKNSSTPRAERVHRNFPKAVEKHTELLAEKVGKIQDDTNDMPRDDKFCIPNNIKKQDITNNNNIVVDGLSIEKKELFEKQKRLFEIVSKKLEQVKKDWNLEKDQSIKKKLMEDWCNLESQYTLNKIRLATAEIAYTKYLEQETRKGILNADKFYMKNKLGPRTISEFSYQRLEKSLETFGIIGHTKNKLINEVLFEVRFGSLVKSNQISIENSVEKAINIAIKLIRENRWQSPVGQIDTLK